MATDIFEIKGPNYLILSDYFSKFLIVRELSGAVTAVNITDVIEDNSCVECLVDQIRSDQITTGNVQVHTSQPSVKAGGIDHVKSSLNYAQSNGFVERQVRWVR